MLSAVGFREDLVVRPAEELHANRLVLVASPHPKVKETLGSLKGWAKKGGLEVEVFQLKRSFDFVEWYYAWMAAGLTSIGRPVYVNLTAGHAVAISTASLQATKKGWPCVCWDDQEDMLHHLSPSILLKLDELIPRDREALRLLADGPQAVSQLVPRLGGRQSTVSHCLDRLENAGFLTLQADPGDGRRRVAELRPGVRAFLSSILAE
jgi:DNA-binding MarR family transcriptional regulator